MSVNRKQRFRQPAVPAQFRTVDSKRSMDAVLREHDYGTFRRSACLVDEMFTDDRIQAVANTRAGGVLASDLTWVAANKKRKAAKAAEFFGGTDDVGGHWRSVMAPDAVKAMLEWGWFLGIAVAEIIWTFDRDLQMHMPRLVPWHPQHIRWDWQERRYKLWTEMGEEILLPDTRINPRGDGKWVLWTPHGYDNGWTRALVRSLGHKYIARQWNEQDWRRFNERHGMPILAAKTPGSMQQETDDSEFFEEIANVGSDAAVNLPQGDGPGESYDLAWVETVSTNSDTFKNLKGDLDVDIAVAVLGQNLTTEAQGGSFAMGKVQDMVRGDKKKEDAEIAQVIYQQEITWWAEFNLGDPSLAPRPEYQTEPEADDAAEANADRGIGDALLSMQAAGVPVDEREYVTRRRPDVPLLEPEPEVEEAEADVVDIGDGASIELTPSTVGAIISVNEARATKGMGPLLLPSGKPDPDGALTISEFALKRKSTIEGAAEIGAVEPPAQPDDADIQGDKPEGDNLDEGAKPDESAAPGEVKASAKNTGEGVVDRYEFQGFPIAVENPAGSSRVWKDESGERGRTKMLFDYGFIEGQLSGDGEELDVYVGKHEDADTVFVVHQLLAPDFKKDDEDKVFLGFKTANDARDAFLAHRGDDDRAFGGMTAIPLDRFRAKLKRRSGTKKITASAIALKATRPRRKKPNPAQDYTDRVATASRKRAAKALQVDLAAIMGDVNAATSPADLRKRLTKRYESMNPDALAVLLERAGILSEMNGQAAALEEV